jgi:hypothetical protein
MCPRFPAFAAAGLAALLTVGCFSADSAFVENRSRSFLAGTYQEVTLGLMEGAVVHRLYLLPDYTYLWTSEPSPTFAGDISDEGRWSVQDTELVLLSSHASGSREGTVRLIIGNSADVSLPRHHLRRGAVDFEQIGTIKPAEIASVRKQVDHSVGRYSLAGLFQRYRPSAASIEIPPDGSVVAMGAVTLQIGSTTIAADRIEFAPDLDVIHCTGHARILSGDLGSQRGITVFFDGRQIYP